MENIDDVKTLLLAQQRLIQERLESLNTTTVDDESLLPTEVGTFAWLSDIELNKMAQKKETLQRLEKIKQSLQRLEKGTYGICEKCGNPIEAERLHILPTSSTCSNCR